MSAFVHTAAAILVGGVDASGFVQSFDFAATQTERDEPTYGSGGYGSGLLGVKRATMTVGGLQDLAATGLSTYLADPTGTQYAFTVSIPGSTAGDPAWVMRGKVTSLDPILGGTIDETAKHTLTASSDTRFGRGALLLPVTTDDGAASGSAVALAGPTATQSLYVALHVTATTGGGTWTVLVESDNGVGMATPTTRLTFSTFTTQGWQFQSVAGSFSTETHLRVAWSVTGGTAPTATFAVAAFVA